MLRRALRAFFCTLALLALAYGGFRSYYHWRYPYGPSHRCILIVGTGLQIYAERHNGRFPQGKETPEASLSLIAEGDPSWGETLCGKHLPPEPAMELLKAGKLLTPETCGWHYVEGLTLSDDPKIAIVWNKVPLGHNGERDSLNTNEVYFLDGSNRRISEKDWPAFLAEQERLHAARSANAQHSSPGM